MLKINRNKLDSLYRLIAEKNELYLPVKNNNFTNFAAWTEDADVDLDTLKTVKSPKDAFFPQSETLYTCKRDENKKLCIEQEERCSESFVVFGVRPCDARAMKVLDNVFLTDSVDSFYAARRRHGIIVSIACSKPEVSCFCNIFGIDNSDPSADADVAAWFAGDFLYWKPVTEKGKELTESVSELFEDEDDDKAAETVAEAKKAIKEISEKLPYRDLSLEGWNGDATDAKFGSPVWDKLYKTCLGCGTCTFVCPTCQCYDIKDFNTGDGIKRFRCWDSCMYSDFTLMAAVNSRTSQLQRFRQRFMHKLVYYPANNNGMYSCVGCGRCVEKCPSHLNIVKVIKAFEKEENV